MNRKILTITKIKVRMNNMVELELNKVIGDVKADFKVKLKYRINIVTGDSATG